MLQILNPRWWGLLLAGALVLLPGSSALPQTGGLQPTPRLEPVAETRLLMDGMAQSNFRGLERLLRERPASVQAWTFARGQALLIAETANLLMMRPPRTQQGQVVWFDRAVGMRESARELARAIAAQDFNRSRSLLVSLANTCNRCHTSFRIRSEVVPFSNPTN